MKSPDVSSDVSIDISSDEENGFSRKSRLSFDKMAAKGWSTCADGFDEGKETPQSKSQLYSGNWASVSSSNNVLKAVQRKKERKKAYHKYSGIPCHRFRQFLKENIDIDPDFIAENVPKRYSPIVIHCHVDNNRKLEIVPKMENPAKWVYSNFSESFCEASDVNGSSSNASIRKKRPLGANFMDIDVKLDSMPSGEEVIEDNGSSDPCSLQSGLSDEIVTCSPSPQPLQEMTDLQKLIQCSEKNSKYSVIVPKMPSVPSPRLTISHNTVRSADNSDTANTFQKGSDWLKSIAWHNSSVIESCDTDHDEKIHSNKTRKFIPGGFAEQAAKVEKKTRHSRLVWSHQKRGKAASEKCLTVQLCPFHVMNGIMLSKCVVVKKPISSANTSIAILNMSTNPCNTISKQESVNQDSNCEHDMAENVVPLNNSSMNASVLSKEHCFLLLKPNIIRGLKLTVGSIIRIYPPWQSLDVPSLPYPVILCSYYIDVLDLCTSLENSLMQGVTENTVFESNDCCKNNPSSTASSNQKTLKQQKRLDAVSQTKDIRKFFKEPQKDTVVAVDTNADGSSVSSQHLKGTCQEATLSSRSWDQSFLSSFCISGAMFSLCGRVQRIWQIPNTNYRLLQKSSANISPLTLNPRYSLIVQDKRSQFFMIHLLNFQSLPNSSWSDLLKRESRCFQFSAVKVTQILQPSKFPTLFTVLKHITSKQTSEAQPQDQMVCQQFCYQVAIDCGRSFVIELPDNSCPSYCLYEVSSLDKMIEKDILSRFSCCAKVFCEVDDVLYITDKFLQKKHSSCSYVKISFWSRKVKPSLPSGSNILIAEAVVQKDGLYVDRYSTVMRLPQTKKDWNDGFLVSKVVPMDLVKDLDSFFLNSCTFTKLHPSARVGDLVTVKGIIYSVDEDTAVSWLECNLCGKETLYQDAECRILCSLCNCIVEVPKLSMKMHISVQVIEMLDASIIVELSCLTTKRILEIPDNVCLPKCNVTDVLHKKIGPLVCLVRSHENLNGEVKFKLQEIVLI